MIDIYELNVHISFSNFFFYFTTIPCICCAILLANFFFSLLFLWCNFLLHMTHALEFAYVCKSIVFAIAKRDLVQCEVYSPWCVHYFSNYYILARLSLCLKLSKLNNNNNGEEQEKWKYYAIKFLVHFSSKFFVERRNV